MNFAGIEAAIDCIQKSRKKLDDSATLNTLVGMGARVKLGSANNTLYLYGITGSCTWSTDRGLIDAWYRNAVKKMIMRERARRSGV